MVRVFDNTARAGLLAITGAFLSMTSCIKTQNSVVVEGGDKPIHIVLDVNVKLDRDLDQFFSYEQSTSQPATQTTKPTM